MSPRTDSPLEIRGVVDRQLHPSPDATTEGRLRYVTGGSGRPVVLLHTVRTQAEHFHRVIPRLVDRHSVYALDLPGMGRSEIVPGASYDEAAMRAGVTRLLNQLDLDDVVLVGESMGAVLAMTVAADLPERVSKVVAVNPYDYRGGIMRSGPLARFIIGGILTPGIGRVIATQEPRLIMRSILAGGLVDRSALTDSYLDELLRAGERDGHPAVARAVYRNLPSLIEARQRYAAVRAPVTFVYGASDWSRPADREANRALMPDARFIEIPAAGHFIALERPDLIVQAIQHV